MSTYTINAKFDTQAERTDRVLEIAESFGLGLDDKEFVVFDNLELDVKLGDVVYITGESGSGKSLALRELTSQMAKNGLKVANIDDVKLDRTKPLIDQIGVGLTTAQALDYLNRAGLTDANLWIRKPQELSDGQRYRFKLAKVIESGANVWVADEFCAVLDRVTAKAISFSLQKLARMRDCTLMVATTHSDMVPDLAPSITINKRYREKVSVVRHAPGNEHD